MGTELVAVYGMAPTHQYAARMRGVYYRMTEPISERKCYQKLLYVWQTKACICDGVYIFFSSLEARWKIATGLNDTAPCLAYSTGPEVPLANVQAPWQVQDGDGTFDEDIA